MTTEQKEVKIWSEIKKCIDSDACNYPELRNYKTYCELLKAREEGKSDSPTIKLIERLVERLSERSVVDLVCTVAGAINFQAYSVAAVEKPKGNTPEDVENSVLNDASTRFWDSLEELDQFVERYYNQLFDLALSRTNCPTVPQRAFPLATFLPKKGGVGVLELGCSRGDLGLVLLNPGRFLRPQSEKEKVSTYVFDEPTSDAVKRYKEVVGKYESLEDEELEAKAKETYSRFGAKRSLDSKVFPERSWQEILRKSRSIDKYYGVDLQEKEQTAPGWLLALWGLLDPRRKVLARFYRDFKNEESRCFKRTTVDALDVEKYLDDALDFMSGVDNLVLFTSYMVYQLDIPQRYVLMDVARRIKNAFETRFPGKKFYWFNQGNSVAEFFTNRELNFGNLRFSELRFNEANRLYGRDLAILADDCNSNWRAPKILVLYGGPARESLISVKSANTVVNNLYEAGFSCAAVEIPQDVLDETSRIDGEIKESQKQQFQENLINARDANDRANARVKAILEDYKEKNGKPDLVFPYLHGIYGEDGRIQKVLEDLGWHYVGCDSTSSELGMDKNLSKKIWSAQIPSCEYWIEKDNEKRLTTFEWNERLRRNMLWLFDRIKIEHVPAKGGGFWRVVKDDSVDFSKASTNIKNDFAQVFFGKDSYEDIDKNLWSKKLGELVDVMLRRWEYDVFIYEYYEKDERPDFKNYKFSFTSPEDSAERQKEVEKFLNTTADKTKTYIVERRYEAPVLTAPWILVKKTDVEDCIAKKDKNCSAEKGCDKKELKDCIVRRINAFNNDKNHKEKIQAPCILKPYNEGSSFNTEVIDGSCSTPEKIAGKICEVIEKDDHDEWILEPRLSGIDVTVSVLGSGDDLLVLPPLQIRPRNDLYDYEAKYFQEDSTYLFKPYPIQSAYFETMKHIAAKAYRMLGCRDFTRIDLFMVDDEKDKTKKRFYVLEANTIPGATVHSLTPKSAMEAGFSLPEFFRFVIEKAFLRYESPYAMREIKGQDLEAAPESAK